MSHNCGIEAALARAAAQDQVFTLSLTQTWVRTAEGWRCLAGHAGSPQRPPAVV